MLLNGLHQLFMKMPILSLHDLNPDYALRCI